MDLRDAVALAAEVRLGLAPAGVVHEVVERAAEHRRGVAAEHLAHPAVGVGRAALGIDDPTPSWRGLDDCAYGARRRSRRRAPPRPPGGRCRRPARPPPATAAAAVQATETTPPSRGTRGVERHRRRAPPARARRRFDGRRRRGVGWGDKIRHPPPAHVRPRTAGQRLERVIAADDATCEIRDHDRAGDGVEEEKSECGSLRVVMSGNGSGECRETIIGRPRPVRKCRPRAWRGRPARALIETRARRPGDAWSYEFSNAQSAVQRTPARAGPECREAAGAQASCVSQRPVTEKGRRSTPRHDDLRAARAPPS